MKKLLFITTILFAAFFVSCSEEYDDSALTNRVDNLESRVERLEELCAQMNTNISSLQTIVNALQQKDFITTVAPINKDGKEVGYSITFSSGKSITIYHGNDGKDGADGSDGEDGKDGADGHTPIIGVKQASDGVYYWTVDGEWLLDSEGNKIRAEGKDGLNGGKDGEDGADGITPQLKIENNYWYISYDNGATWTQLGQATGDKGDPGLGGDSMFTDVDYYNGDYVIFTLSNGAQIKVPTWASFERLQTLCNQMNTNIESLQAILTALQNNDYIKEITPIVENGLEIGYTIVFTKSKPITIYHGKDGKDGQNGADGTDGKDGEDGSDGKDGEDGHTPIIGVKKDVDGIYYWTVDGEWLLDADGNKIKAQSADSENGEDGADGADGKDGKDGITPQLKIEDDYWYVSYDNGATWTKLGKAKGEDGKDGTDGKDGQDGKDGVDGEDGKDGSSGDNVFQDVTQDANHVYFVLSDGTTITIPKAASAENIVLTYIPRYSDGKATVFYAEKADSYVELDFEVSPASAAANWRNIATVKAVYTETRAGVEFVDMAILDWSTDTTKGTITVKASGKNLSDAFFAGSQDASARLVVNGNGVNIMSEYVPMVAAKSDATSDATSTTPPYNEIWYTSTDGNIVTPYKTDVFGANIVSNTYEDGKGIIEFDGNVTTIGEQAFFDCGRLTSVTLPNSVTEIGFAAFNVCNSLASITIPDSVTEIGYYAFSLCYNLTSITIPDSVTVIKSITFFGCRSLTSIIIPDGVTEIGSQAFEGCSSLTSITIPDSVTVIGWSAFEDCSRLTSVTIPDSVTSIEHDAFYGCSSLTSVTIGNSVTEIGNNAFYGCSSLTTITIPDSVTWINGAAFYDCSSLTSVTIGNSVTEIGYQAFQGCSSLTSVTIPDNVTMIGPEAFFRSGLAKVVIGSGVKEIYSSAFGYSYFLNEIICKPTTPPTAILEDVLGNSVSEWNAFDAIRTSAKIYVPIGSGAAYKAAEGWKEYASIIEEKAM